MYANLNYMGCFSFINKYTRAIELENMRHRTKEVSKQVSGKAVHYNWFVEDDVSPNYPLVIQLRDEETKNEDRKRKEQAKQRADRKRHEELQSRKSSLELMDDAGFMDVSTFLWSIFLIRWRVWIFLLWPTNAAKDKGRRQVSRAKVIQQSGEFEAKIWQIARETCQRWYHGWRHE